ncbi:unnamed protein product [Didymodactylos carnosus]|uniref:Uncharacterized protein n=1 Tax=Didymodactylos carnosus TaxID=1234261 RepID=A0A814RZF4_9BILA|nr:unnamed protein product [Didymodactylos carnosus]CAF1138487.1 unnamed protein product [Didymodactylos carnosus]CAF3747516.1 unnamed protein product [Didymodactylos carnosus]CAF3902230.1 unnamed protein product [Didymodactylos carnosus]
MDYYLYTLIFCFKMWSAVTTAGEELRPGLEMEVGNGISSGLVMYYNMRRLEIDGKYDKSLNEFRNKLEEEKETEINQLREGIKIAEDAAISIGTNVMKAEGGATGRCKSEVFRGMYEVVEWDTSANLCQFKNDESYAYRRKYDSKCFYHVKNLLLNSSTPISYSTLSTLLTSYYPNVTDFQLKNVKLINNSTTTLQTSIITTLNFVRCLQLDNTIDTAKLSLNDF